VLFIVTLVSITYHLKPKSMYKFSLFFIAFFSGCILLAGCSHSGASKSAGVNETQAAFDTTAAKREVEAANRNLTESLAKGDSVGVGNCYLSDAKFMASNMPAIVGRKNIQATFAGFIKGGATKLDLGMINLWGNADLLAEEGTYALATKDGHQLDKGKYIVIWKKEGGKWKISRDCNNSDLPVTK
jgi:ketosteroid isomerase-like protein